MRGAESADEAAASEVIDRSLHDSEGFAEIFRRHFHIIRRYASARLRPTPATNQIRRHRRDEIRHYRAHAVPDAFPDDHH